MLPTKGAALDEDFMQKASESASYWKLVNATFENERGALIKTEDQIDGEIARQRLTTKVIRGKVLEAKLNAWVS
jgi:hypothetical protein